ncbi:MAG: DNA alkylation repair protein [Limisphaerales bacterium]
MTTLAEVMKELAARANATCKRTYLRHGAKEPLYGVRVGDLKPLQRKLRGRQDLALELYATGNSDAMYLAGLIADGAAMTRRQLDRWVAGANWHMIAGCTVPWVAAEHPEAIEVAMKWIDSKRELTATAGWSTLSAVVATRPDTELPLAELGGLLDRVADTLASAPNRVRYAMNSYIITCGTYVASLGDKAIATARKVGVVEVDMGETACQVPDAESYIAKSRRGAAVAPKRKTVRC